MIIFAEVMLEINIEILNVYELFSSFSSSL